MWLKLQRLNAFEHSDAFDAQQQQQQHQQKIINLMCLLMRSLHIHTYLTEIKVC